MTLPAVSIPATASPKFFDHGDEFIDSVSQVLKLILLPQPDETDILPLNHQVYCPFYVVEGAGDTMRNEDGKTDEFFFSFGVPLPESVSTDTGPLIEAH